MKKSLFALLLSAVSFAAASAMADGMPEWTLFQRYGALVLHTEGPQSSGEATIEIMDVLGKRVASFRRPVSSSTQALELPADLTPGFYLVKIQVGADLQVRRIRWQ